MNNTFFFFVNCCDFYEQENRRTTISPAYVEATMCVSPTRYDTNRTSTGVTNARWRGCTLRGAIQFRRRAGKVLQGKMTLILFSFYLLLARACTALVTCSIASTASTSGLRATSWIGSIGCRACAICASSTCPAINYATSQMPASSPRSGVCKFFFFTTTTSKR